MTMNEYNNNNNIIPTHKVLSLTTEDVKHSWNFKIYIMLIKEKNSKTNLFHKELEINKYLIVINK